MKNISKNTFKNSRKISIFKIAITAIALTTIFAASTALAEIKTPASMQHKNKLFSKDTAKISSKGKVVKEKANYKSAPKSLKTSHAEAAAEGSKMPASMRNKLNTAGASKTISKSDIIEDSTIIADIPLNDPEINVNVPGQNVMAGLEEEAGLDILDDKIASNKIAGKKMAKKGFGKRNYNTKPGFVSKVLN
jgi:hypothetical protein